MDYSDRISDGLFCRDEKCGAMIRFITNPQTGAKIPVEHAFIIVKESPKYLGKTLISPMGLVISKATEKDCGYEPHWPNCPGANRFRAKSQPDEPSFFNL